MRPWVEWLRELAERALVDNRRAVSNAAAALRALQEHNAAWRSLRVPEPRSPRPAAERVRS